MRGLTWQAPAFFISLREQWARDGALWRSIGFGLGMAVLGLAMTGSAFGVLTP